MRVTTDSVLPAVKFLGIYIDPLLNFKYHLNSINSKISKSLYFLRAVKKTLTPAALKSIYYSTIHAHFIYGINIWSCTPPTNLNNLFAKQKTAIRIITNSRYNAHTETLFKNSKILPLKQLVEYFNLQFFHRFTVNELPSSFQGAWMRNVNRRGESENETQIVLRNNQNYYIPQSRLISTDRFPLYNLPRIWSDFTETEIKNSISENEFNSKLKLNLLGKLSSNYTCTRLLCPHCHLQT